jgi:hypothetical protein
MRTLQQQPNIRALLDGVVLRGYVDPHDSAPVEPICGPGSESRDAPSGSLATAMPVSLLVGEIVE